MNKTSKRELSCVVWLDSPLPFGRYGAHDYSATVLFSGREDGVG